MLGAGSLAGNVGPTQNPERTKMNPSQAWRQVVGHEFLARYSTICVCVCVCVCVCKSHRYKFPQKQGWWLIHLCVPHIAGNGLYGIDFKRDLLRPLISHRAKYYSTETVRVNMEHRQMKKARSNSRVSTGLGSRLQIPQNPKTGTLHFSTWGFVFLHRSNTDKIESWSCSS